MDRASQRLEEKARELSTWRPRCGFYDYYLFFFCVGGWGGGSNIVTLKGHSYHWFLFLMFFFWRVGGVERAKAFEAERSVKGRSG